MDEIKKSPSSVLVIAGIDFLITADINPNDWSKCHIMIFSKILRNSSIDPEPFFFVMWLLVEKEINTTNPCLNQFSSLSHTHNKMSSHQLWSIQTRDTITFKILFQPSSIREILSGLWMVFHFSA